MAEASCYHSTMQFSRKNRRFTAWFACLAMVLNFLAPAVSHAMASEQGNSLLMEICSAASNKFNLVVELNTEKPADGSDSSSASMQHCSYCLTHAGTVGMIPDVRLAIALPDASYSFPELFYHSPYPLFAWVAGNPRAPPAVS